jgi:hypothetical protein
MLILTKWKDWQDVLATHLRFCILEGKECRANFEISFGNSCELCTKYLKKEFLDFLLEWGWERVRRDKGR